MVDARPYSWLGVRIRDLSESEMEDLARRHGIREGFGAYITDVIEDRRVQPRDDLTSILTHAELVDDDGVQHALTLEELISELLLILVGGNETTRNVISGEQDRVAISRPVRSRE